MHVGDSGAGGVGDHGQGLLVVHSQLLARGQYVSFGEHGGELVEDRGCVADAVFGDAHDEVGPAELDHAAGVDRMTEAGTALGLGDHADLPHHVRVHEVVREILGRLVTDVLEESRQRIIAAKLTSVDDVRACGRQLIGFSPAMAEHVKAMRAFLMPRMYHHQIVRDMRVKAEKIVEGLFDHGMEITGKGFTEARKVADDIAAMTDRQAMAEYEQVFGIKL